MWRKMQKIHVCSFCCCTQNPAIVTARMVQKGTLSRLIWSPNTKWFIVYIVHMLMQVNTCTFRFTSSKNATKPPLSILKELTEFLKVQMLDKGWIEVPHQCLCSFFMRWFYFFHFLRIFWQKNHPPIALSSFQSGTGQSGFIKHKE